VIEQLVPAGVAGHESFTDVPESLMLPAEAAQVSKAVEKRRREFERGLHAVQCAWLAVGREAAMAVDISLSRSEHSKILTHLRTLRASLSQARDALMHFKDDRLDRDTLEPAARRVDDLMNMFVSKAPDPAQGSRWVTEIQSGVEQVKNPKAAEALHEARVDITALLDVMGSEGRNIRRNPLEQP